jgi:hypothetical protein
MMPTAGDGSRGDQQARNSESFALFSEKQAPKTEPENTY